MLCLDLSSVKSAVPSSARYLPVGQKRKGIPEGHHLSGQEPGYERHKDCSFKISPTVCRRSYTLSFQHNMHTWNCHLMLLSYTRNYFGRASTFHCFGSSSTKQEESNLEACTDIFSESKQTFGTLGLELFQMTQ